MISRGSSVHHSRRTNNPFMTTSSGIVGIDLQENVTYDAPRFRGNNPIGTGQQRSSNSLTEFMYQTTSGALGEGVRAQERLKLSQRMDKPTVHNEVEASGVVTIRHVDVAAPEDYALRPEEIMPKSIDIKPITQAHSQHPLYATSCRDIGAEKAQLKVEVERLGRPNTFTNSFNGFRYRDFGLNTAVTKSRICDQLEYS
ncbi:uncharacterized protein PITG_09473 [Phytophthora infestans T30-4]|uniref:Uncharacterized protein n=2 Tax=Phytophthora infestans TaxID=4787 RepID=D0NC33_PHYIT|nr:uncharacterized protein PITG_09473 [Phytophthora infestans T30-4]EEY55547.1 conserved hypothetical protein [Phytophthora infestans T30-4]KAF4027918.1 hypothetical protein GN244_ATG20436 [Phytophthora infestans]KAF4129989.1 hypothetical protein GN958_ATG20824 [Phytophthora infestans]KAF4133275.1 hypothetical protein GN958_ATG17528 [Phytophthora infestans]|eukprot:XP_002903123.1 conserved hypothetical protein [Phytophthora infestans T30-4]